MIILYLPLDNTAETGWNNNIFRVGSPRWYFNFPLRKNINVAKPFSLVETVSPTYTYTSQGMDFKRMRNSVFGGRGGGRLALKETRRNTPISEFKFYGHFDFPSVRRGSKLSAIIYISNNLFDNALTHTPLSLPPRCVHVYILIKAPFLSFLGSYNNILFLRENKDWVLPTKFGIFGTLYILKCDELCSGMVKLLFYRRRPQCLDARYKIILYIINGIIMYE